MSILYKNFRKDFAALVSQNANKPAFIINSDINCKSISYSELDCLIDRCLNLFENMGLMIGDTILVLMPNSVEMLICFLASIKGGYIFSPIPCFSSRSEFENWINLIKPNACFITDLLPFDIDNVCNVKTIFINTDLKFEWLPDKKNKVKFGDNPKIYIRTSGTTGKPKAIVLDSNKLWSSGCAFMDFHNTKKTNLRFWNYLPMSYLGGLFNLCLIPLCIGGSVVVDDIFSGKTFLKFWQTIERFDINAIWFVPSIVRGVLELAKRSSEQERLKKYGTIIKLAFVGTAPIDKKTKQEFYDIFNIQLLDNFALSETTFLSSETIDNIKKRIESSVGEILPYVDLKFVKNKKSENVSNEICIKTPFLFDGYLDANGVIKKQLDKDGYFSTEDLGSLEKNMLVINGRQRDIIKKGGYLIHLKEIEVLAESNEFIKESACLKVEHDFYGESFRLYVILNKLYENIKDIESEIVKYIHDNLVKYKWPEEIIIKKKFPRTESGKICKHLLSNGKENENK